jgi:hypothetical protein
MRAQQVNILRSLQLSAVVLAATTLVCFAGPCSPELERMQARLDAKLHERAGIGPSAPESSRALEHRQPTPGSIAAAEIELGELSLENAKVLQGAMDRARAADRVGDKSACDRALADVQRTIGP